jgi:hypothetical protein
VQVVPALVVALLVSISRIPSGLHMPLIRPKSSNSPGSQAPIPASWGAMMGDNRGDNVRQTGNCGHSDGKTSKWVPAQI